MMIARRYLLISRGKMSSMGSTTPDNVSARRPDEEEVRKPNKGRKESCWCFFFYFMLSTFLD